MRPCHISFQEKDETLRKRHVEDMQAQLTAHKATVEMLKDQAEKDKKSSLETQQERHNQNLGEYILVNIYVLSITKI